MNKWIFAILGFIFFKIPGAIFGYFIGTLLQSGGGLKINSFSQQEFELNLLALASLVIKADGRVSQRELDFVRNYFIAAYGKDRSNRTFGIFNNHLKKTSISAKKIGKIFNSYLSHESRLQVVHFLFGIANADGSISSKELEKLHEFSYLLGLSNLDFESIKAMFIEQSDNAYKILEVKKTDSNEEIKKAYREMAKKHHPDKVQHLGEAYIKASQEKFQKIQKSYEKIKTERGF